MYENPNSLFLWTWLLLYIHGHMRFYTNPDLKKGSLHLIKHIDFKKHLGQSRANISSCLNSKFTDLYSVPFTDIDRGDEYLYSAH